MTHVLRVDVDATVTEHDPGDLAAWQHLVGGYIEGIHGPGWSAYVNEEGRLDELPPNAAASIFVRDHGALGYGVLVGPVVLFGPADEDGNETDAPAWLVEQLTTSKETTR